MGLFLARSSYNMITIMYDGALRGNSVALSVKVDLRSGESKEMGGHVVQGAHVLVLP